MLGIIFEIAAVTVVTTVELLKHNARLDADELARLRNMTPEDRIAETLPTVVVAARARMDARHAAGRKLLNDLVTRAERQAREAREAADPRFRQWSDIMR